MLFANNNFFNDEYEASLLFALIILPFLCIPSFLLAKVLSFFIITTIENKGKNRTVHFLTTNNTVKYFYLLLFLLALVVGFYFSGGWIIVGFDEIRNNW